MRIIRKESQEFVPAGHENPLDPGVLKRVLLQRDDIQIGHVQMVNWARLLQGKSFAAHYHEDMQEVFIILNGSVRARVDAETTTLNSGDTIVIDAHEIHEMWNDSERDVDYLAMGIAGDANGQTVVCDDQNEE